MMKYKKLQYTKSNDDFVEEKFRFKFVLIERHEDYKPTKTKVYFNPTRSSLLRLAKLVISLRVRKLISIDHNVWNYGMISVRYTI